MAPLVRSSGYRSNRSTTPLQPFAAQRLLLDDVQPAFELAGDGGPDERFGHGAIDQDDGGGAIEIGEESGERSGGGDHGGKDAECQYPSPSQDLEGAQNR